MCDVDNPEFDNNVSPDVLSNSHGSGCRAKAMPAVPSNSHRSGCMGKAVLPNSHGSGSIEKAIPPVLSTSQGSDILEKHTVRDAAADAIGEVVGDAGPKEEAATDGADAAKGGRHDADAAAANGKKTAADASKVDAAERSPETAVRSPIELDGERVEMLGTESKQGFPFPPPGNSKTLHSMSHALATPAALPPDIACCRL